jgi:hypothetical protein
MDACDDAGEECAMGRYRHQVYAKARSARFCVLYGLQWQVIECFTVEPAANLERAMITIMDRLAAEGWQRECSHEFGFVFLRRAAERRLLILTERNPYDQRRQSFSPFG